MVTRVRALAFPIFQKDWLYFTLQVSSAADADAAPGAPTGLASWSIFKGVKTRLENEWQAVRESKPGSFKHIALRYANPFQCCVQRWHQEPCLVRDRSVA